MKAGKGRIPPSHPEKPPPVREPPLVLIVDDFRDNREMYAEYFQFAGFRTEEAANGLEALEKAFSLLPDLIVMDLSLPELDGWEATRRLKRDEKTSHIPVIALTGHALKSHSRVSKEAGCDSFVTKPCLPSALIAEVRRLLESRSELKTKGRK